MEWLEQQPRYRALQLETKPSDSTEKDFVLDDIIATSSEGLLLSFQVKHAESPEQNWSLKDLLETPPVRRDGTPRLSLLERWKSSFQYFPFFSL